jgi:hypothetical protein
MVSAVMRAYIRAALEPTRRQHMIESAPVATYPAPARQTEQLLPLPAGGAPQTVYITITSGGLTPTVAFSLSQGGTQYADGMTWSCSEEYGLFLNFIFLPSTQGTILSVKSDAPVGFVLSEANLSPPAGGFNQQGCVQNVEGTYKFHVPVRTASGTFRVDPKIVVTPDGM